MAPDGTAVFRSINNCSSTGNTALTASVSLPHTAIVDSVIAQVRDSSTTSDLQISLALLDFVWVKQSPA